MQITSLNHLPKSALLLKKGNINTPNCSEPNNTSIVSSQGALALKANALSKVNFGSRVTNKSLQTVQEGLTGILKKYSQGEVPVILETKENFIPKLAKTLLEENRIVLGVSGQSASGKTTKVLNPLKSTFPDKVTIISGDNYYKDVSAKIKEAGSVGKLIESGYSFDDPGSVNLERLAADLVKLKRGEDTLIPVYHMDGTGVSIPDGLLIQPKKIIAVDSIFALNPEVKNELDIKVFVHKDPDELKKGWYARANSRNNTTPEENDRLYADVIAKGKKFIEPGKKIADVIVNGSAPKDDVINMYKEISELLSRN